MGWSNPPVAWSEFEQRLSGVQRLSGEPRSTHHRPGTAPSPGADGGDSPAWSLKRAPYTRPARIERGSSVVPYAELHAHSSFSFLDGASSPEALIEEAERLGLHGLALTDHDGLYGVARFAEAAENSRVATVYGAELSLGLSGPQNGEPDPEGTHLLVLARGQEGYHRLSAAITAAQLAGAEKGRPRYELEQLAEHAAGRWRILTGCRKGAVRQALGGGGALDQAARELDRLVALFGRDAVVVELIDHGDPLDSARNDALAELAACRGLPTVATGNVHYATPGEHRLQTAIAAVRARRSLDELDGWLPASAAAHLRSGEEMRALFGRFPGAIERSVELADELAFELRSAKPGLPGQQVPAGHTPMSHLRQLVWEAVPRKYGDPVSADVRARVEGELAVIDQKDFPGYFLIVHDIVRFARAQGILCQGRGSAASSAVCYLLDITAVDAIEFNLPFERFISSMREEEPDIDVDFDSDRREEVIQYVYGKYGRDRAAQVATVIQYRPKNAVRDMAKALGHSTGQQDAWSKQVERWDTLFSTGDHDIPAPVLELASQALKLPRHLGIHSGGMVLTDRPVGEVVPIEHARMEDRTVVQWDKDDCAWMGLVKFDLLGLGMLSALQHAFDLVEAATGERWDLGSMPREEAAVYDMLCRADAIGVFQVESRAQMGLLPRLQPREFYDLVVQIALVRPGPIQGGAVHPFVRRKLGQEKVSYPHPLVEEVLKRTKGVPIFQEQLMQMAVKVGNCSPEDADLLRRAMGSKRGLERIESLREKLYAGMAANGIEKEVADNIYARIQAFADFGFAESHALSFGLLVYASSWIKLHYPAAFLAALLRAQPMGFYSAATLSGDARRHGVEVRRPELNRSGVKAGLEPLADGTAGPGGRPECAHREQPKPGVFDPDAPDESAQHRRDGAFAVRLGLAEVTRIGEELATRIVADREEHGPFASMENLVRRVGLTTPQLEALAAAGALDCLGLSRREALWRAGSAAQDRAEFLPGTVVAVQPPLFADPSALETLFSDLWATGLSTDDHPLAHARESLTARGVLRASDLRTAENGRRTEIAGLVTHRQRPATASGITFLNIEDETGLVNVICSTGVWKRHRRVVRDSPALLVRGMLERSVEGVTNILADNFEPLGVVARSVSRDFR